MKTLSAESIKKELELRLPDVKFRRVRESFLIENPENLIRIVFFLKESPEFRFDYLSSVTGVDYLEYLESVYHLYSMKKKLGPIVLRVRVPKKNAEIPSLTSIYQGAEYQEREIYDTFGIVYKGHPDLRRLFMWEGFEGHPLRKDYIQEDSETLETEDIAWLEKHHITVPADMKQKAQELQAAGKRALAQKPEKPRN